MIMVENHLCCIFNHLDQWELAHLNSLVNQASENPFLVFLKPLIYNIVVISRMCSLDVSVERCTGNVEFLRNRLCLRIGILGTA